MSGVHFASPQWVHALWGVVAVVSILFALEHRRDVAVARFLSPEMRTRLVAAPSAARRRLAIALLGLCGACLVLGLMRPQWGFRHFTAPRVGAEIMVALDVSRSMLAEDVAPSRLARAKAEVADLLTYLDGDQVGLIAFAGRATVLSPLTPDFGFLRLALDAAAPESVTRGGTKLAEPIRKALAGFGPGGDASRAILLITDGEDHDSFVLDAARETAEAGVKIIAIGFGDEAGTEIPVTDPRTGARTLVLDSEDRPVRSRLDGDLLREVALATGGAYVPAGTGVLDLASIYERHIARLTRGHLEARGRTVRDEHYQWPVLLGVIFLVSSVLVSAGPPARRALALGLLVVPLVTPPAGAEEPVASEEPPGAESGGEAPSVQASPAATEPGAEEPRTLYNRAVAALDGGELEGAERSLEGARARAGTDGELRFRATYNLGVAEARSAEALESDQPEEALSRLHRAAAWFQEAVSQRPDDADARHNLEVTLRRALLLEDRLARQAQGDLEQELDTLAGRQRGIVAGAASLLERARAAAASDPHAVDRYRGEFAGQATGQRTVLSDADALAERVANEADALESGADDETTPDERMRAVALSTVLEHLHSARERMGQARSQLRRRQAERAYRRASAALQDLKRARDALRDPVSLLDAVIGEVNEVAAATDLLAAAGREIPGLDRPLVPPAWLDPETLLDSQRAVTMRAGELRARLRAGVDSAQAGADPGANALVARTREAEPFVAEAHEQLQRASAEIEGGALQAAGSAQRQAIASLLEARERFLDLRGLIEATYTAQSQIEQVLRNEAGADARVRREYLASLQTAQEKNRERAETLARKLGEDAIPSGEPGEVPDGAAPEEAAERLRRAREALDAASSAMADAARALGRGPGGWSAATDAADRAVDGLEALRRLYLSIGERVRELADRQLELADATRDAAALGDASPPERRSDVLAPRQETLAERAGEVALDLAQQSDTAALEEAPEAADSGRRLRSAGEHVLAAEDAMKAAASELEASPERAEEAHGHQDEALRELDQALALLAPPDSEGGDDRGSGGSQREQSESEEAGGEPEVPQAAMADPAQLLQAVRDREAQRRRERARGPRVGYEPVEKDW